MSPMTVNFPDRYNCSVVNCGQLGIIDAGGTLFCSAHAVSLKIYEKLDRERRSQSKPCDKCGEPVSGITGGDAECVTCFLRRCRAAGGTPCQSHLCENRATRESKHPDQKMLLCDLHYNADVALRNLARTEKNRNQPRCQWDPACKNTVLHTRKHGTKVGHFCDRHYADTVRANPTRPCDKCGEPDTGVRDNEAVCFECFKKKHKKPTLPGRPKTRTIALDFDGVLHRYQGYKNGRIDGPIAGARMAIRRMLERGHKVVVFSTRDSAMIVDWLAKYDFPKLPVTATKSPFWVIVDDRAVTFDGAWTQDLEQRIENFTPYWLGGAPAEGETPWPEDGTSTFDVRL